MYKNSIKIFFILILSIIIFSPVAVRAAETITLVEAVEMALEENTELEIAEKELENARLQYEKSRAQNLASNSKTARLEAEYNLSSAKDQYEQTKNSIINDTIKGYTDLLQSHQTIKIREENLKLAEKKLKDTEEMVDAGESGELDLLKEKNNFSDAEYNLDEARRNNEQLLKEFKTLINYEREKSLELQVLDEPDIWEIEEKKAVELALENNRELLSSEKNLELTEAQKDKELMGSTPKLDREISKNDYEIARLERDNTRESIENSVPQLHYQLRQSIRKLELEEEKMREAKESYELVQEQHEAGLSTETELLESRLALLEAEQSHMNAVTDYYLQEEELRNELNLEAGVLQDEEE
ncbi:MAG: TolC family protein [Halanaerobiales bacterium]